MTFKTTLVEALGSDVNIGNTVLVAYPAGTDQATFLPRPASPQGVAIVGGNEIFYEALGQVAMSFGASSITITNLSPIPWPKGASLRLQLDQESANELEAEVLSLDQRVDDLERHVVADVPSLLANTSLTYSVVTAGYVIETRSEGFAYQVAASGASDHHVITAGGVKLYVLPGGAGFNVKAFGALGDGATDDTAEIQKTIDVVFSGGGGTVYFPAGTYRVTGLSLAWGTSSTSMKFVGAGKRATVLQKLGVSAADVFAASATTPTDGAYSEWADMTISGISTVDGFKTTNIARSVWRSVYVTGCDAAVENLGSLINTFYDCDFMNSVVGYRARKNAGVYCNLIEMFGGAVRNNTQWGFDIGDTSGFHLYGTDIESNGTAGNTSTGAFITRDTCDDEIGYSTISINGAWFESNYGWSVLSEACAGLSFSITDTLIIASEAGRAASIGAIGSFSLNGVTAGSAGDTISVAASRFSAQQSTIGILTNSATFSSLQDIQTAAGTTQFERKSAAGTIAISGDAVRSKTGQVATTSGVAATLFSPSGGSGRYEVWACIDLVGSSYMAVATIGYDGSNVARIDGVNGANLSITVSGSNVQVTQTSGVGQTVRYSVLKIGHA